MLYLSLYLRLWPFGWWTIIMWFFPLSWQIWIFFLQTNKKSIKIIPIITLYHISDHVKDALSTIPGNLYRVSSSPLTSRPTTLFDSDLIGSKHLCRKCVLTKLENLSTTKLSEIFCFPAQYITNFKKFVST